MSQSKKAEMERILGAKLGRDESRIPGSVSVGTKEFRYYSGNSDGNPNDSFSEIFDAVLTNHATKGSANNSGCRIFLPDGTAFYALSYWNDIEGWRKNVEEGVKALGLKLAWIENDDFVVEDGRRFKVADCGFEFY